MTVVLARRREGLVTTAAAIMVAAATWELADRPELVLWIAVLVGPVALAAFVARRYLDSWFSPVVVVPVTFVAVALAGTLFGRRIASGSAVSAVLELSDTEAWRTTQLLAVSATALLAGAVVVLSVSRRWFSPPAGPVGPTVVSAALSRLEDARLRSTIAGVAALPLVLTVALDGTQLLDRTEYLIGSNGNPAGFTGAVGLAGVVACGLLLSLETGARRLPATAVLVGYFLLYFALGSRQLALFPILLAVGAHVARPRRATRIGLVIGVVAALALLPIPLYLRGLSSHGLLPYLAALPSAPRPEQALLGTVDNILISYPLIGVTAYQSSPIPLSTIWIELNPLPGDIAGWYDVSNSLRVNPATPFATIGELGNIGWSAVLPFWLVVGGVLGYLDRRVVHLTALGSRGTALVLTAIPLLFTLLSLQYNLRASVRLLLYALAVDLAWLALTWLRRLVTEATAGPQVPALVGADR